MKHVFIELRTKTEKNGETTEKKIAADLLMNNDTRTRQIFDFVRQAKRIEREAIKAAKAGTFYDLLLVEIRSTMSNGRNTWAGGPGNAWRCTAADVCISETWPEENHFYMRPEDGNENPNFDILVPFGKLTDELNI